MSEFDDLMRQKAVALKYNPEKNGAPVIVASGMGYLAERITETAWKPEFQSTRMILWPRF